MISNLIRGIPSPDKGKALYVSNATVVVTNTSVRTTLAGAGAGSLTIPASEMQKDTMIITDFRGIISRILNPTLEFELSLGGTLLAGTGGFLVSASADESWQARIVSVVRGDAVAGEIISSGSFITSQGDHTSFTNSSPITIDTTIDQLLDLTFKWSEANSGHSIECHIASVTVLNV